VLHPCLSFIEDAKIVACCDLSESRARATADRYGLKYYLDLNEMLHHEEADAALVVSYPDVQSQLTTQCLEKNLNVFTEKPLAVELKQARAIHDLCMRENLHLGVGFMKRFNPAYVRMKEAVLSGGFGGPTLFYAKFAGGTRPRTSDLFRVGSIHMFDLARYVVGEIKYVSAAKCEVADGQASIAVNVVFESGCVGTFLLSSLAFWTTKWSEYAEVIGEKNLFVVDNCRTTFWQKPPLSEEKIGKTQMVKEVPSPAEYREPNYSNVSEYRHQSVYYNGYFQILQSFVSDLLNGRSDCPSSEDGIKALEIALAVEKSIESKKAVAIN
jgi:predicted dehydrogenase